MIKTTDQHCHNFIYYIFHEFFSWYSKIWTTTHPLGLICSPLLLLAYTRFSVWITYGDCLRRKIMIFVSCPVFYIWIEEILQKYPDMYVPPAAPSLTNYYLLYFFGFNDISKWAHSMSLLLLLGQTLSIKYVEIKRHMLYRTPLYNTTWLSNHSVAHNIFSR